MFIGRSPLLWFPYSIARTDWLSSHLTLRGQPEEEYIPQPKPRLPTTSSSPLKRLHWFDDPAVVGYSTNKLITRTANNLGIVFPYCVCSYLLISALTVSVYCVVYTLWFTDAYCGALILLPLCVYSVVHCYYPPTTVAVTYEVYLLGATNTIHRP